MAQTLVLAAMLAFNMPAFHLFYIEDGKAVESVEDLTLKECKSRVSHYKKRSKAQCLLVLGPREYI